MQPDDPYGREVVQLNSRNLVIHQAVEVLLERVHQVALCLLDRGRVGQDLRESLDDSEE